MPNILALSSLRLTRWLFIVVTIGAAIYMGYFVSNFSPSVPLALDNAVSSPDEGNGEGLFNFQPASFDALAQMLGSRNIFSTEASVDPSAVEQVPVGQLPGHLRIVGIIISNPSSIVIEDTLSKQTYFIAQGAPQGGISIAQVKDNQIIITYQGQDIAVPINQNANTPKSDNAINS